MFVFGERRIMRFCSFWIVAMISPKTAFLFWQGIFCQQFIVGDHIESKKSFNGHFNLVSALAFQINLKCPLRAHGILACSHPALIVY